MKAAAREVVTKWLEYRAGGHQRGSWMIKVARKPCVCVGAKELMQLCCWWELWRAG